MPTFSYTAKDMSGKTLKGVLEVESRVKLVDTLRQRSLVIVSIQERGAKKKIASRAKVKSSELVVFSRQLATMVDSGIPLVQALDVLASQMENKAFKAIVTKVRDDVEVGSNLSDAMAKHPRTFSTLFVNMVKAGESSGQLDEILDRVAGYLEKSSALQRKVKGALVYPALVTSVAILITAGLLIFVIPRFADIFTSLGGELPLPTQILLATSDALRKYFLVGVGALCVLSGILRAYTRTTVGQLQRDRLLLDLPLFGPLLRKVAVAKFARTLATLVRSGVAILASLEIVGKTSGNAVLERAVGQVRTSIREGENISEPLAQSGVFPTMVVRMISVGEQTGELEKMLGKIADFYEDEVDVAVSSITSLIEPLIIVFLGVVVGGIVIALFMPIFKLTTLVS